MRCNNLSLVLGLGLVRVSSRVRVKVRVSVLVRVSIRTSWMVNFALFRCYRPVIYTRPMFVYTIQPGLTTGLTTVLNEQPLFVQPIVKPVTAILSNRL